MVVRNALLDQKASSGGRAVEIPFWKDLDADVEANVSTDNPADIGVPQKVTAGVQIARVNYLNQGYSAADLAAELAGSDPMQRVRDRFGVYWTRQWSRRLIKSAQGVLAANVANDSGDMVFASNAPFSRTAFLEASFTLGDQYAAVTAIAVHSAVLKQMEENDEVDTIPASQGTLPIRTYMGKPIIVDDTLPAVSDGGVITYTCILFGAGAFGYGVGSPKVPVELDRQPSQGNGGGVETLWERQTYILHPSGYQFTSASVAGESPTQAELALAANWSRVVERKNVPLAFLTCTEGSGS